MPNNLAISITADIVDLQTKFAVAKAEVNGLTSEMNKLAKASAAGIIDPAGTARLQQVAGDLLAARQQTAAYAGELEKAGFATSSFGRAMESGHGSIATATREFRALFDELSSGRTRQTPGTLAIIAQRVLGLGPAALGAVAGVGALAGGLAYLAYRAISASNAIDQIDIGAKFAGNLAITRDQLTQFADELGHTTGVSQSDAREIVGSFASMHDMSAQQVHALSSVVRDFAVSAGQDTTKAAEELAKVFASKETAAEYARSLGGVTQEQINMAEAADKSGNAQAVFASKLDNLNAALDRSRGAIDRHNASIVGSFSNWISYLGLMQSDESFEQANTAMIEDQTRAREKQLEVIKQTAAAMANQPASPEQTLKAGVSVAEKENPVALQVQEAKTKVQELDAALEVAEERGDAVSVDKLAAGLEKVKTDLSALQFGPVLEQMREQISQVAAAWDGSQSGMLQKQIQIAQGVLASVQSNSKERLEIETEISHLEVQQRQAAGQEIIANARNQVTEIAGESNKSAIERLEAERGVWAQILAGDRITAQQRLEVQRSLNQDIASIERERQTEAAAIARSNTSTDIAIARITIEAKKTELETEVESQRITAAQKLQIMRDLTNQEAQLNIQAAQTELAGLETQPTKYAEVYNQIREMKAKLTLDLEALDKQYQADLARQKKEEYSVWKASVSEIESVEDNFVSNILTKRKSLSQSIIQIGQQLVTKEIENDTKAYTSKLLLQNSQKALEQGGLLYHLLYQGQQLQAVDTSQAQQTAAVISGNAARNGVLAAAAAQAQAVRAASGPATVMGDAALAAAGTFASVAQIPYVGWALAPGAAAAAFAEVSAYAPLASLDVGAWNVPHDMVAQIHKGEMVVPKNFSEGIRENGGFPGGSDGGTIHNYGNISMADTSMKRLLSSKANQRAEMNAMAGAYRRGAR